MKVLCFEGAGWEEADISKATIGNCRIRTAFHNTSGQAIYLEISGVSKGKTKQPEYVGHINHCFMITDDSPNDDENKHSLIKRFLTTVKYTDRYGRQKLSVTGAEFPYAESSILKIVHDLGGDFDHIRVVNRLGGYRVFKDTRTKGTGRYNYGDEFQFDEERVRKRELVDKAIYNIEKKELEEADRSGWRRCYPNYSLWTDDVDPDVLHLLRHFVGQNKHYLIRIDSGNTVEDWLDSMTEKMLGRYGC